MLDKNCVITEVNNHKKSIIESLKQELNKSKDEETSFQIRLFDDITGKAFYKQLTQEELVNILKSFDEVSWC